MEDAAKNYLYMGPESEGVAVLLPAREASVEASPHGPRLIREGRGVGHRDVVLHFAQNYPLF